MAMRNGSAQMSSSMEMMARSLTASESKVTPHMVMKPSTVDGIVRRLVVKVPKLSRVNEIRQDRRRHIANVPEVPERQRQV